MMLDEQLAYIARPARDPFFARRLAEVRTDLATKRMENRTALRLAERLAGRRQEMALANAARLGQAAEDLAATLRGLTGGR